MADGSQEIDDGGPAFPGPTCFTTGMTLRDYFAGQALAGIMSRFDYFPNVASDAAYSIADAMLKQREESGGES